MTTYKKDDEYLQIMVDEDPIDNRKECDVHVGTMVCWHRSYILGDEQPAADPEDYRADLPEDRIELPLYLYDHSGITMRTAPFSCKWDSGQVGFIYTTPEKMKELGVDVEKAEEYLRSEVEQYDYYLTGEVYGFTRYKHVKCETCAHIEQEVIDSCRGFYGYNHQASGLLETAGVEKLEDWEEVDV